MRVYEANLVYSLVSLGEEIRLDRPEKILGYLRSYFEENPVQEASYCVLNGRSGPQRWSDVQITRVLRHAAKIVDIDLLDHIIVGDAKADPRSMGYYSFRESGVL